MKLIYVGSPLTPTGSDNHAIEYLGNVRKSVLAAKKLLLKGHAVYCPALDFQYFLQLKDGEEMTSEIIKKMNLEILKRCDALFLVGDWFSSVGCMIEYRLAIKLNISVFESEERLERWLSYVP